MAGWVLRVCLLHGALHILTDEHRAVATIVIPPMAKHLVIGCFGAEIPIDLRNGVIYPSLFLPQHDVGIKVVVVLRSIRGTSAFRILLLGIISIYTKRRNAKFHPRLHLTNQLVEFLDELVHIVAPPIAYILKSTWVCLEEFRIGNGFTSHRIRIEIIVHVDAIHVVALQNILHHHAGEHAICLQSGIHNQEVAILKHLVWVTLGDMIGSQFGRSLRLGTIRINPRMAFHIAFVALIDHPSQWVPSILWCHALHPREITAPRLEPGSIECITLSTHLKQNGIDACTLKHIQLAAEHIANLLHALAKVLSIHTLNPRTTKLSLGIRRFLGIREQRQYGKHQK